MNETITMIPVAELFPHPNNPRKDLGDLTELADSIAAKGVLQNLTVVPGHDGRMDGYTVVIGHRRLAAAKKAGLTALPCSIVDMNEQEIIETMLLENMQRSDLTVYEQAKGFQMMLDFGNTMEDVAKKTGFSRNTIKHRLEIMKLDQKVLSKVSARQPSLTDFMKLEKLEDMEARNKVLATIGTKNFENTLQTAIEDEKRDRAVKRALDLMDGFAEIPEDNLWGDLRPVESFCVIDKQLERLEEFVKKGRPEGARYYYRLDATYSNTWLYIRRYDPNGSQKDERKIREEAYSAGLDEIESEFKAAAKRHYKLRIEFVKGLLKTGALKAVPNSESTVTNMFFTLLTYATATGGHGMNWAVIETVLGRKFKKASENTWDNRLDAEDILEYTRAMPTLNLMLIHAYGMIERTAVYARKTWYSPCWRISKADTDRLQCLYGYLSELGYELSDEEATMMDGTHELFAKADQLRDEYLKELEAAGDEK